MPQESNPNPSVEAGRGGPVGPYELAMFLAGSLGRALPVVVIIGLVAYGAYFGVSKYFNAQKDIVAEYANAQKELSEKQREVSDAENSKNKAQADAREAGDKAKNEALQKYSDQLEKLNSVSADVSKRVQELVSRQLDNMKKLEEGSNTQLQTLQKQIADTQKELDQSNNDLVAAKEQVEKARQAASQATYEDMLQDILKESRGYSIDPSLLTKVDNRLEDAEFLKQVKADAANTERNVLVRMVLLNELFKKTLDQKYLDDMTSLVNNNPSATTPAIAGLLVYGSPTINGEVPNLRSLFVGWVVDDRFGEDFRDRILSSFSNPTNLKSLSQDDRRRITQYAGKRLLELSTNGHGGCNTVTYLLSQIQLMSPEAALVYAWEASNSKVGGYDDGQTQCIKEQLSKALGGQRPAEDAIRRWHGSESASTAVSN